MGLLGWLLVSCFVHGSCLNLRSEIVVAKLPSGTRIQGRRVNGVPTYAGIRYATARRFAAPELWTPGPDETIDAMAPGPRCPQGGWKGLIGTEDCLFLGVIAPDTTEASAVMFFIHGGTLEDDTGDPSEYTFQTMASEGDVIIVSIEYRLGLFGFYSDLETTISNNGLRDQIAALQWVQQNIQSFGGDPERVTVFGQSAGGLSVLALMQSPLAQDLFHRGIAQSPGYWDPAQFHTDYSKVFASLGQECLKATGCKTITCMRERSMQELYKACPRWFNPPQWLNDAGAYFSGYDGQVLKEPLHSPLCEGRPIAGSQKPLIVGTLTHEWKLDADWIGGGDDDPLHNFLSEYTAGYAQAGTREKDCVLQHVKSLYVNAAVADGIPPDSEHLNSHLEYILAAQLGGAAVAGPRYRYLLDFGEGVDSAHMSDLRYFVSSDPATANAGPISASAFHTNPDMTGAMKRVGKMLRDYWTSFAKTGVPASVLGPKWEPVNPSTGLVALPLLGVSLTSSSAMNYAAFNHTAALLASINCGHVQADLVHQCKTQPVLDSEDQISRLKELSAHPGPADCCNPDKSVWAFGPPSMDCKHGLEWYLPVVDVIRKHSSANGPLMDGFCYFGVQPSCTTSHRSRDYKSYALGPIGAGLALDAVNGKRDTYVDASGFRTMPGVSLADAKWCHDIGALNVSEPEQLLANADALESKAQEMCEALGEHDQQQMTMAQLKHKWDRYISLLEMHYRDPVDARPAAFASLAEDNRWIGAWNCAMGTLGCELALCLYHYCWQEDSGSRIIGQGDQCRKNYMQ